MVQTHKYNQRAMAVAVTRSVVQESRSATIPRGAVALVPLMASATGSGLDTLIACSSSPALCFIYRAAV
jgi:hypothetical protein